MAGNHNEIEKKLWEAADQLRANSKLKSSEYSIPVLGLIFLRYADHKFSVLDAELKKGKVNPIAESVSPRLTIRQEGFSIFPRIPGFPIF